jgi:hypothetical protein
MVSQIESEAERSLPGTYNENYIELQRSGDSDP